MSIEVTIFYEDSQRGANYSLHELIMQMVVDDAQAQHWELGRRVKAMPRNGIDNLLQDLRRTSLHAGTAGLYALVDRDKIIAHVNKNSGSRLPPDATEAQIIAAMEEMRDAKDVSLRVFFLDPNMEGLIAALHRCADDGWEAAQIALAMRKQLTARDHLLTQSKAAARLSLRRCIRDSQRGLDALVLALIEALALAEL